MLTAAELDTFRRRLLALKERLRGDLSELEAEAAAQWEQKPAAAFPMFPSIRQTSAPITMTRRCRWVCWRTRRSSWRK